MEKFILALPKLSLPNITVTSTFLKLIEEIGEAKEQIRLVNEFEKKYSAGVLTLLKDSDLNKVKEEFQVILKDALKEIIDITQTCVSLLFVFEESKDVDTSLIAEVLNDHLKEVSCDYTINSMKDFYITEDKGFKVMNLPTSDKPMDLLEVLDDIVIASGQYAQLIGKYSKLNGEENLQKDISEKEIVYDCLKSLIRIAQNSYDALLYMSKIYGINIRDLFNEHVNKLKLRGYLT